MNDTNVTTAITEYTPIAAVLADLTKRHKGVVFDCTQPSGLKEAKAAAKDIAQYRIALEKKRTELKADVLERGRLIDGEAKRISSQLAAIEDPIVDQIKAEERRIEAERQAAIVAEQERLAAIDREKREAEERRILDERAKIAAERADLERQQAAQREAEEKARRERDEADRQARAKLEADERASRDRIAAAEAKARSERQAEEDRLRVERERLDAERRALEDAARAEQLAKDEAARAQRLDEQRKREAEENARAEAEREKRREEQEAMDARSMLDTFVQRFGHRKEFASVVTAIKTLLRKKAA